MEYSVLMSVYTKEEPAYLDTAIQSMLDQTVRTVSYTHLTLPTKLEV